MLKHNLIQNIKYLNFDVDNFILFFYIYDILKLFSHQIICISIMLKLEQTAFNYDLKKKLSL